MTPVFDSVTVIAFDPVPETSPERVIVWFWKSGVKPSAVVMSPLVRLAPAVTRPLASTVTLA